MTESELNTQREVYSRVFAALDEGSAMVMQAMMIVSPSHMVRIALAVALGTLYHVARSGLPGDIHADVDTRARTNAAEIIADAAAKRPTQHPANA